jgi:hypothetical protein
MSKKNTKAKMDNAMDLYACQNFKTVLQSVLY